MSTAGAAAAHHAREYETIYILRPNAGEEAADKVSSRIVEITEREQGKLVQVEVWGRRRLAYKIRGHGKGVFYYLRYLGYPGLVEELERNMRMLDAVLKYQTVKLADEVDPATVEVDPEALDFGGVDFSDETEEDQADTSSDEDEGEDESFGLEEYEPEPLAPPPSRRRGKEEAKPSADEGGKDEEE